MRFSITHIVPITYGVLCPFYAKFGLTKAGHLIEEEGVVYLVNTDPDNVLAPPQAAWATWRIAQGRRAGRKVLSIFERGGCGERSEPHRLRNTPRRAVISCWTASASSRAIGVTASTGSWPTAASSLVPTMDKPTARGAV